MTNLIEEFENLLLDYAIADERLRAAQDRARGWPGHDGAKHPFELCKAEKAKKQISLIDFVLNNSDFLKQQLMELIPKD